MDESDFGRWTKEELEQIQTTLQDALVLSKRLVEILDAENISCGSRVTTFALLMVARLGSDEVMPDKDAFSDVARLAAGYLELQEKKGRSNG